MNAITENSNDKQLWNALKSSNELAFTIIYKRYVASLYSYGRKVAGNDKIVEDAIHDLFIDLWQMREGLSEVETARFYLYRSLRRKIHRQYKSTSTVWQEWDESQENDLFTIESLEEDLIKAEVAEGEKKYIALLMKQLSSRQKEAILLYYYENFTYTQVADIMHVNEQSARNLIQRALDKLRRLSVFQAK